MITIYKIRADHVVDFAAEELKKYLRMMMPRGGEIKIAYDPEAKDGFRLGLLEDFGLPNEAEDSFLDDVIHIDTDEQGGILAGSNPRSILFAVYRYLKLHGCRWLYPGVDGEHIPVKQVTPQKYHKLADTRFRGNCNEGCESQTCMLETIDFYTKLEMNVYMLEHDIPYFYYDMYYSHDRNEENRIPEPVPPEQVLQWKRQCEVEMAKRGLQFHDMGHGWTAEPFGLISTNGWNIKELPELTDEQRSRIALVNGKRDLYQNLPMNTNLCMSQPEVRKILVDSVVEYAKNNWNVDYLHVWLADGVRGHCECDACRKKRPTDWYMMIMEELDQALTAAGLDTRIVFIAYVDTLWAPLEEKLTNFKRFSLLYAPIHRSYSSSVTPGMELPEPQEFVLNKWTNPPDAAAHLALLRQWQENFKGPAMAYEYHFWRHQYYDPSGVYLAKRIYEDIQSLSFQGLQGYIEDGSQRSFFPNGFAMYTYANALMHKDLPFEEILEDYYSHIYGEDWKDVLAYLEKVRDIFNFSYLSGEKSEDVSVSKWYSPKAAKRLEGVAELAKEGVALAESHRTMPTRPQTVSYRLLERHAEYIEGYAKFMILRANGKHAEAWDMSREVFKSFGRHEWELERYFDFGLAYRILAITIGRRPENIVQEGA